MPSKAPKKSLPIVISTNADAQSSEAESLIEKALDRAVSDQGYDAEDDSMVEDYTLSAWQDMTQVSIKSGFFIRYQGFESRR